MARWLPFVVIAACSPEYSEVTDGGASPRDASESPPACAQRPDCERVVFVTSTTTTGALGGLDGADATCTAIAARSSLARVRDRRFRAWLSTIATPAGGRLIHGTRPYVTSTGAVVATSWDDLVDGELLAAIRFDESGNLIASSFEVFTGTSETANPSSVGCKDWTDAVATSSSRVGSAAATDSKWTYDNFKACTAQARLYCFEE